MITKPLEMHANRQMPRRMQSQDPTSPRRDQPQTHRQRPAKYTGARCNCNHPEGAKSTKPCRNRTPSAFRRQVNIIKAITSDFLTHCDICIGSMIGCCFSVHPGEMSLYQAANLDASRKIGFEKPKNLWASTACTCCNAQLMGPFTKLPHNQTCKLCARPKRNIRVLSAHNCMDPRKAPTNLPKLTQTEQILLLESFPPRE